MPIKIEDKSFFLLVLKEKGSKNLIYLNILFLLLLNLRTSYIFAQSTI